MAYGDINIQSLTVGGIDLASANPGLFASTINIYESLLDPLGPHGEIRVVDGVDVATTDSVTLPAPFLDAG